MDWLFCCFLRWLVLWLVDSLIGCLFGCLMGSLIGWFVDGLIREFFVNELVGSMVFVRLDDVLLSLLVGGSVDWWICCFVDWCICWLVGLG